MSVQHYKTLPISKQGYKIDYTILARDKQVLWRFHTEINGELVRLNTVADAMAMVEWHSNGILDLMMNVTDIELYQEIHKKILE
jgi:hypothetical protein